MHKSGKFNIQLRNYRGSSVEAELDQETRRIFADAQDNNIDIKEAVVFQVSVAQQFQNLDSPIGKFNIGYSVFETNRVPFSWVIPSNLMDAICVPCGHNKEAFEVTGVTVPVHVVPHGCDRDLFEDNITELESFKDGKTNFLFVGTTHYRKGIDLAITSFIRRLGKNENARLICKIFTEQNQSARELADLRKTIVALRQKHDAHKGEIVIIHDYLSQQRLLSLYKTVDALVFPSRGEGWGFSASEASALGTPVITTNWGGPAEYLNNDVAFLVDYKMVPVSNMLFNPQFFLAEQERHLWAEPDLNQIEDRMEFIMNNPQLAKEKGQLARKHMKDNYSWDRAGEKLVKIILDVVNK